MKLVVNIWSEIYARNIAMVTADMLDVNVREKFSQNVQTGYGISHGPLLDKFISTIIGRDQEIPVTALDGIKTTKVVHALYKSDEVNDWVKINTNPISDRLGVSL